MEKYDILKKLGQGTYGTVYLCTVKATGRQCVMKRMLLRSLSDKERASAHQEAEVLRQLSHPNIVAYIDALSTRVKLYLIMQYCDGGDLEQKINAHKQAGTHVAEAQLLDWFVQMALALQYLHESRILHRDLKTANIFLTRANIVKLGDFGVSRVLEATDELARTKVGTPCYISPERCAWTCWRASTSCTNHSSACSRPTTPPCARTLSRWLARSPPLACSIMMHNWPSRTNDLW